MLANKILKSSFWQYIGSWVDRLLGFVSTLILARILLPDDFGVVAAAMVVTGFFHVISCVGTDNYILRKAIIQNSDLNTGWTINIIMNCFTTICIMLLANKVSEFMGDDRLIDVLYISAISPLIMGFNNTGLLVFRKNFNYKPLFIIGFSSRIAGFFIKISLALYLVNYWAFVWAGVFESIVYLIASFILSTYRPRFSLISWKEQWEFSQWVLLKSIFVFVRFRIDNIFLSKYLPLETLGIYSVAKDVATLPSGQIIGPIMDPLYVGLSSIHKNNVLFADKAHKTLAVMFLIVLPISLGTYITAGNLVPVVLGAQWDHATPIVMILALTLLPVMLGDFLTRIMTALGKVKLIFKFELLLGIITITTFALLASGMELLDFATLRVALVSFNTLFVLWVLTLKSNLSFFRIIGLIILPLMSSLLMALFIIDMNNYTEHYNSLIKLCIQVSTGALFYLMFISLCIYTLRNNIKEYQFIWKTFYLSIFLKK